MAQPSMIEHEQNIPNCFDIKNGIQHACEDNDLDTVKRLFVQTENNFTFGVNIMDALSTAIEKRNVDIITYLFTNGVYLDKKTIISLIEREDYDMMELLRGLGWDINQHMSAVDPSPLPWTYNNPQALRWMLDCGADPNTCCAYNCTPMSFAVCFAPSSVIGVLFAAGGNASAGQLLHHAIAERRLPDCRSVVRALVHRGTDLNERADYDHPWPHLHRVLRGTALHCAARRGDPELVAELLAWGADPFARDSRGNEAWQIVQSKDHLELLSLLKRPRWIAWCWMAVGRIRHWLCLLHLRLYGPQDWESEISPIHGSGSNPSLGLV